MDIFKNEPPAEVREAGKTARLPRRLAPFRYDQMREELKHESALQASYKKERDGEAYLSHTLDDDGNVITVMRRDPPNRLMQRTVEWQRVRLRCMHIAYAIARAVFIPTDGKDKHSDRFPLIPCFSPDDVISRPLDSLKPIGFLRVKLDPKLFTFPEQSEYHWTVISRLEVVDLLDLTHIEALLVYGYLEGWMTKFGKSNRYNPSNKEKADGASQVDDPAS